MKLPAEIKEINIYADKNVGAYPPNGFIEFGEGALGNGDCFGLYWELGKEDQEPMICEMQHEEGTIVPSFSSLKKFLEWYELNDQDWGEEEVDDENFMFNYLNKGNEFLKQNKPELAIEQFKLSIENFGESSETWFKLAGQQKRVGNELEFQKSIINSILSNWAVEFPSQNSIRFLKTLKPVPELADHPLIKNRERLEFSFGGKKTNDDYLVLQEIITELFNTGDIIKSLLLEQNYALCMESETTSFQERYSFDAKAWKEGFTIKTEENLQRTFSL